jgi:hypothetical protein
VVQVAHAAHREPSGAGREPQQQQPGEHHRAPKAREREERQAPGPASRNWRTAATTPSGIASAHVTTAAALASSSVFARPVRSTVNTAGGARTTREVEVEEDVLEVQQVLHPPRLVEAEAVAHRVERRR